MQKTRVVAVTRLTKHPQYHKYIKVTTRYKAHDEENQYQKGDQVIIEESRPRSKDKRWTIVDLIKKAQEIEVAPEEVSEDKNEEETSA